MNNNERGRITGMPGVEVSVTLHPQRLSTRMRNSVSRMLETRVITGGWGSQGRRLATAIAEKYEIQCSINGWNGLRIVGISPEAAPLVRELVTADWTAWLLDNSKYNDGYYRNAYELALNRLDGCDQNFFITMHDKESIRKVVVILAEHTTQEMKDKSKQVADKLRGTEPIHIVSF
jgi:hypothetical protein